ncbi:MAG: hypothetical protein DRO11_00550 [Methanobacteriota archaeon]|nr:MAG: hypothetical protein DRO11_00550 [Euryarchaeota archaeon]
MRETSLATLALVCALLGLASVVMVSQRLVEEAKIGELSQHNLETTVQISGVVVRVSKSGEHVILRVSDGTGQVTVPIFGNILGGVLAEVGEIEIGDMVTVRGKIEEYRGVLEVVPASARGVRVTKQETQKVVDTDLEKYMLRVVEVVGVVVRKPGDAPFFYLGFGGEEIRVYMPPGVAWPGVGAGESVRVVGAVTRYGGVLELVARRVEPLN